MSMASEVMKLIVAVLGVSCNSGNYTVIVSDNFCTLISIKCLIFYVSTAAVLFYSLSF